MVNNWFRVSYTELLKCTTFLNWIMYFVATHTYHSTQTGYMEQNYAQNKWIYSEIEELIVSIASTNNNISSVDKISFDMLSIF